MQPSAPARFAPLLGSLLLLLLFEEPLAQVAGGQTFSLFFAPLVMFGLVLAVGRAGRAGQIAVVLWIATFCLEVGILISSGQTLPASARIADLALVGWSVGILLREIVRRERVTFDTLLGGISVYLMIGFFFSILYTLLESLRPGSFLDHGQVIRGITWKAAVVRYPTLSYFSFVTLTTLGYGDIVPVSPFARSFAATEALLGPLYLAVLVSALVGLHLSARAGHSTPRGDG